MAPNFALPAVTYGAMSVSRVLNVIGRVLVGGGALVLLFTAYQLWGTGLFEAHSQSVLRSRIDQELPAGAEQRALRIAASLRTQTTTTEPTGAPVLAPAASAPAEGQPLGVIQISSIGLDQVVVEGVGTTDLRMGPGHYPGTPLPGQGGNAAIAGHRTTYGHPFYNLNVVKPGAPIVVTTRQGIFVYAAQSVNIVAPSDSQVLAPTAAAVLTLTTCNPRYSASQRLVVRAQLERSLLFPATTGTPATAGNHPPGTGHIAPGHVPAAALAAGSSSDWVPALLWGLLTAAVAIGVWLWARRSEHRWIVYSGGTVVFLVVLFFFFASIGPLLPATF